MTKKSTKKTQYSNAPDRDSSSSDSDNDDKSNSKSTTVEPGSNGHVIRKTITTKTTRRQVSSGSGSSSSSANSANGSPSLGFITRVASLPLVHDGFNYAKDSKYGKFAIDTASNAVGTVNKYTENYQKSLQPALNYVDGYANSTLDIIEKHIPIIKQPTEDIYSQVKRPFNYLDESSRGAYAQITSTIDNNITTPAKQVTNNITTKATSTASQIASGINENTKPLVNGLETIVNRYLPGEETTTNPDQNQATRVIELTLSVSSRVSARFGGPKSREEALQWTENSIIVTKSKESIQVLNQKFGSVLEALQAQTKELQTSVQTLPRGVSDRVSSLNAIILAQIDSLSAFLRENAPALPASLQARLQSLVEFLNERYVVFKGEIAKSDLTALQKARNILQLTTEETLPILQQASNNVKEVLVGYQIVVQENVQKGINKAYEVNSSLQKALNEYAHQARYIAVGAK